MLHSCNINMELNVPIICHQILTLLYDIQNPIKIDLVRRGKDAFGRNMNTPKCMCTIAMNNQLGYVYTCIWFNFCNIICITHMIYVCVYWCVCVCVCVCNWLWSTVYRTTRGTVSSIHVPSIQRTFLSNVKLVIDIPEDLDKFVI